MGRNLDEFIIQNFKKAIDLRDIQPFYQPVIRTLSGQMCSFEALARWTDPELGMIYPDEFIPVLEREGLIHLLDIEILRQVCARIRNSIANGKTPIPVSVNLSRLDFNLCDIFTIADNIISNYHIPHDFIYFEITESVVAEQKDMMMGIVDRFRSAGYQIWMDDFGSAYSSLNVLKEVTFDELKLDMSFLRPFNLRSKRIITAIVKMAKVIDIHTLAEGVETEDQLEYLRDIGCEKVQGYYFGKPMPYEQAIANLHERDIQIERPQDRKYYDEIGMIDLLGAVPFMTLEEYNSLDSAKQLNSIPLLLAEFSTDSIKILFYNAAFEETAEETGIFNKLLTPERLHQPQPYRLLARNIAEVIEYAKDHGDGRTLFMINEHYYEFRARRMTHTGDKYCILASIVNLTKSMQSEKTEFLDDSIRQIYALYDRITLINTKEDTIRPLYTSTKEDLLGGRHGINGLVEEYAEKYIYREDRKKFIHAFTTSEVEERLSESGSICFSEAFRTKASRGQYVWKDYTLLKIDEDSNMLLVRNINDIVNGFISDRAANLYEGGPYAPQLLWGNLVHSELFNLFWKDRDRRFLGASQGFLDYYGLSSEADIIGKSDEEMGWHIHPGISMNDEYKVIHEGVTIRNAPGKSMSHGENRNILASKTPLLNISGEITGLFGFFVDIDGLEIGGNQVGDSLRRDLLTGLLNYRGIMEEAEAFQDEYYLRGTDFIRIHIGINDLNMINEQHGFDFGDKLLTTFGQAVKRELGLKSAVGRYSGRRFVILQQTGDKAEAGRLREKIKNIGDSIREIDGIPVTLYLSVGYAFFSEYLDLDKQAKYAEVRLHADYDQNISSENRIGHAAELFYMFDDLTVPYAVFHVTYSEHSGHCDAAFFYVNHEYEEFANLPAKAMLGRSVREVFPFLGDDWYMDVKRAALDGEVVKGEFDIPQIGKHYRFAARQIISAGFCAITCVEIPVTN